MQPFIEVSGRAAVLPQANIDTDVIIRINRLTASRTDQNGKASLGRWAFEALRYDATGAVRPDCVLNDPVLAGAPTLIAGPNFGCGSSREGAVWAMMALGFRCVIANSFGDIFHANCFQNGMLPVVLPLPAIASLATHAVGGATIRVDLASETVTAGNGTVPFTLDPARRHALLHGLDDIGQTMQHEAAITAWQDGDHGRRPWMWPSRG